MKVVHLDEESITKMQYYVDNDVLSSDIFKDLYTSKDLKSIVDVLKKYLLITQNFQKKAVIHLFYHVFKNPRDDKDLESYFGEKENAFFKELLLNGGIIVRSSLRKTLGLPAKWDKAMSNLEDMEIGYLVTFNGVRDAVFILDFAFINEVQTNE